MFPVVTIADKGVTESDVTITESRQGPVNCRQPFFFGHPGNGEELIRFFCHVATTVKAEQVQIYPMIDTMDRSWAAAGYFL